MMFVRLFVVCFVLIGVPIFSFLVGHMLKVVLPESRYKGKLQLKSKGLISLFVIVFCLMSVYRTSHLLIWILGVNIPVIWAGFSAMQPVLPSTEHIKGIRYYCLRMINIAVVVSMFLLCLKPVYKIDWKDSAAIESNRISMLYIVVLVWVLVYLFVTFFTNNRRTDRVILFASCTTYGLVLIMKILWRYTYAGSVSIGIRSLFSDQVILFNTAILLMLSAALFSFLGKGWGILLNAVMYIFLFFSNFIKLKYHDTFFTWFDLLQIKELLLIGREFLTVPIVVGAALGIAAVVFLTVKFRKRIVHLLKPHMFIVPALAFMVLLGNIYVRISEGQYAFLDIYKRTWENEAVNVRLNGLVVNLVLNFNALQEIIMDEPVEYSQEMANKLSEQFLLYETGEVSEEKPDVILIMGESLFDLDGVEGLQFDKDIDKTIEAYGEAAILSPRYGGYTSAMEFEALTGLTLAFMPPSLTPFTTYFNNPEDDFPSIVQEFKKNGYSSVAIHPDLADFYNRTIVYENLGFDEYQAIHSFVKTEENTTLNGWITDEELGNRIIDELEKAQQPKFVYAVTMEEHYVNVDKYSEPEVKVSSELLNQETLEAISQQATSYYHTDQMIQKIIQYMDNTEKPTLLYVFGDHLPPLEALSQLGYIDNPENKYRTTLVMYSNYKNIEAGTEYITPNQLAAQIVTDAEIAHNAYFDYIYQLRKAYPVVHQEFVDIEGNEELDAYRFIQYDILFGKRYLVQ